MRRNAGLTLVELVVVLTIVAVLAGLVVGLFSGIQIGAAGQEKSPQQVATEATLLEVRNAIMGTPSDPGYFQHVGQNAALLPREMADLFSPPAFLPGDFDQFDPETGLGWRGPYLQASTGVFDDHDGAFAGYGVEGEPTLIDGWGRPIVIQLPDVSAGETDEELLHIRLVSAGEDGVLQTPLDELMPQGSQTADGANPNQRGDDIVVFLRVTDTQP